MTPGAGDVLLKYIYYGDANLDGEVDGSDYSLIDNGYLELAISGAHAVAIDMLPSLHKDPFDRLLIAQASVEGITLLTDDAMVAKYPGPIRLA